MLLWSVAGLHVLLLALIPDLERTVAIGDRARDRLAKLDSMREAGSLDEVLRALFWYGSPGDYVFFLPAYLLLGPAGVVLQNVALLLAGLCFLWRLLERHFPRPALWPAMIAYLLLPATLFHSHSITSEALFNPLLIIAVYFAARLLTDGVPARRDALLVGGLSAVLAFTRPVYALFPLVIAGLLLWQHRGRPGVRRLTASMLALSFALVVLWAAIAQIGSRTYAAGLTSHGLAVNLLLRADRMAKVGGFEIAAEIRQRRGMTGGEFLTVLRRHPVPFARTVFSDLANITANSGVNQVYGRFLGLFDLRDHGAHRDGSSGTIRWTDLRDKHGLGALAAEIWQTSPVGFIMNAVAGVLWAGFLVLAAAGGVLLARDTCQPLALRLLLLSLPLYLLVFSFVSGGVRWDHRSPFEFVLAILFALGLSRLRHGAASRQRAKA